MTTTTKPQAGSSLTNISHEMEVVKCRMSTLDQKVDVHRAWADSRAETFRQGLTAFRLEAEHNSKVAWAALSISLVALLGYAMVLIFG